MAEALEPRLAAAGYKLNPQLLLSDDHEHSASKQHFRDTLVHLATKAGPDDLLLISFSGHGYTDKDNEFYLLPREAAAWKSVKPSKQELSSCVSEEDLSRFVRR